MESSKENTLNHGVNILRIENNIRILPCWKSLKKPEDGFIYELYLINTHQFSIESMEYPIRFGKYYGNKVFFNTYVDNININPKFIFDKEKSQYVLIHSGYVCFSEQELTNRKLHDLYARIEDV